MAKYVHFFRNSQPYRSLNKDQRRAELLDKLDQCSIDTPFTQFKKKHTQFDLRNV